MIFKRGSTIRFLIDQFSEAEWDSIYPFEDANSECKVRNGASDTEFGFKVEADPTTKTVSLCSISAETWPAGQYRLDIRFTKDTGEYIYFPAQDNIKFQIIEAVTDSPITAPVGRG